MSNSDPPDEISNIPCPAHRLIVSPNPDAFEYENRERKEQTHGKTGPNEHRAEPPARCAHHEHNIRNLIGNRLERLRRPDDRRERRVLIALLLRWSLSQFCILKCAHTTSASLFNRG